MPENQIIKGDLEKVLIEISNKYLDKQQFVSVDLSNNIDFTITLKGENWDGEYVDARIAEYVIAVQRIMQKNLAKNLGINSALRGKNKPLVKVKLKKGSAELCVKVFEYIRPYLDNMNSTQQMILFLTAMGLLGGGWTLNRILKHLEERHKNKLASERELKTQMLLEKSIDQTKEALLPLRGLVSKMTEHDVISFSQGNRTLNYEEAKKLFPRKPKSGYSREYIDGLYEICDINLEEKTLEISQDELKITANLILNNDDIASFYSKIEKQQKENPNVLPKMSLNIIIEYNAYRVKSADVFGTNPPRQNSKKLFEFKHLL